jgi:hypothetical protein
MPRAKRPLAEVELNATRAASKHAKAQDIPARDQHELSSKQEPNPKRRKGDVPQSRNTIEPKERKEIFQYGKKDNSRLRTFLLDRGMSTSGTRDELIERLENSSIDYESLPSEQLTEMLKRRDVKNSATGRKAVKNRTVTAQ